MSAAQHTPGPWTAVQARNEHGDCYSRIVADREVDGACIATTITVPGDDREAMEADAADARLIAAAPDLLDACRLALDVLAGIFPDPAHADTNGMPVLRAAIAKAEGGAR